MTAPGLTFQGRGKPAEPAITAEKGDKRFSAPDWEQNPIFDALKQIYLLTATTLLKSASEVEGLDEQQQHEWPSTCASFWMPSARRTQFSQIPRYFMRPCRAGAEPGERHGASRTRPQSRADEDDRHRCVCARTQPGADAWSGDLPQPAYRTHPVYAHIREGLRDSPCCLSHRGLTSTIFWICSRRAASSSSWWTVALLFL